MAYDRMKVAVKTTQLASFALRRGVWAQQRAVTAVSTPMLRLAPRQGPCVPSTLQALRSYREYSSCAARAVWTG
mgnify:CR=1 FL=1